jgi:hypothetical protein
VESTWENRELVVLDLAVRYFDDPDAYRLDIPEVVEQTGLAEDHVKRALRALDSASPPLVEGHSVDQASYPIFLTGVTERARRLVGAWPSPDNFTDRLIAALQSAAETEQDKEKRTTLKRMASLVGGMGRDIFVEVASQVIGRSIGVG